MLTGTIRFEGKTLHDAVLALEEAVRRIGEEEMREGADHTTRSSFSFELEGDEEA